MKRKIYALLLVTICFSLSHAQGVKLNKENYLSIDSWDSEEFGFSSTNPASFSLKKYCPPVKDQGEASSCVGWSSAYAAMTIIYNIKFKFSPTIIKNSNLAFDPNFIYSIIYAEEKNDCSEGTFPNDAMEALKTHGCKRMMIPQLTDCNTPINETSLYFGKPFRIKEYYRPPASFENGTDEDKIQILKTSLTNNNPLLIGANTTRSMNKASRSNGLWDSFSNEENEGGHAMCLIGYDDNKFGGAFQVMNSWGKDWGDEGFLWIKYNDFLRNIDEIYMIDTYSISNQIVDGLKCLIGDCKNEYSLVFYNENSFHEGEFRNGNKDGYGLYHLENGDEYMGRWEKNKKEGMFFYYNLENDKLYFRTYENDEIVDEESLGFVKEVTKDDQMMIDLIENYKSKGFVDVGDNDDLDE
ncbi:MAG: C1 family peptidase [Flavobacteriales bacterium]|nr:C1 family peptidase [Flavobacteriales bacterium]